MTLSTSTLRAGLGLETWGSEKTLRFLGSEISGRLSFRERILKSSWEANYLAPALPRTYWHGLNHISMSNKLGTMEWVIFKVTSNT